MDENASRAEKDVIATTDSYGGPVSEEDLAEVYLAHPTAAEASTGSAGHQSEAAAASSTPTDLPPDVISDPAKTDESGADWTDEGGATPHGAAAGDSST